MKKIHERLLLFTRSSMRRCVLAKEDKKEAKEDAERAREEEQGGKDDIFEGEPVVGDKCPFEFFILVIVSFVGDGEGVVDVGHGRAPDSSLSLSLSFFLSFFLTIYLSICVSLRLSVNSVEVSASSVCSAGRCR